MFADGCASEPKRAPVPIARDSLCAVEPYVSSATFALPAAMSLAACAAWNSYELPPTAVVSTTLGVMPKYSAIVRPCIRPASLAS